MKSFFTCVLIVLLLAGCKTGSTSQGLERAASGNNREVMELSTGYSLETVGKAIHRALVRREWRVVSEEPGHTVTELNHRDINARLDITYTEIEIVIESDSYLIDEGEREPFVPERWIEYLKRSISQELSLSEDY